MKRIAFATYGNRSDLTGSDRTVVPHLLDSGISVTPAPWDDPGIPWEKFDGIVIRSVWNYDLKYREFLRWLTRLEDGHIPVWNPPSLLRWNTDKSYLLEFSRKGILTVPSVTFLPGTDNGFAIPDWERIVVKPRVGISANGVRLFSASDTRWKSYARTLLRSGPVFISQYQDSILSGEYSLIFFDGVYSHSVLKKPHAPDFRVQTGYGGTAAPVTPPNGIIRAATDILQAIRGPLLYARVDGIDTGNGFMLMELEICDPELFLDTDVDAPKRFAQAIRNVLL